MATLLYAVFEPLLDRVHVSSAGHLPAMLVAPGEAAVELTVPADPPLGVGPAKQRHSMAFEVPPAALLCLYTDGLVERRGTHIDDRLELLRRTLVAGEPDDVCSSVMGVLVGQTRLPDDVALLVIRHEGAKARRSLTLAAEPFALAHIRVALRRWLADTGTSRSATDDLLIAVGEAATNSIKHAYGPAGGTVELELAVSEDDAIVTIRDRGRWRSGQRDEPGQGLVLMERCSDNVQVASRPEGGTEVTIRRHLRRGDSP